MIRAQFQRQQQMLIGVCIFGHAGYSEAGQDIVCAGVSSAVRMTANLLTEVFRIPAAVSAQGDTVRIQLPSEAQTADAACILEGLFLELQQIQAEFPAYLKMEYTEVSTSC